jgi:ubiquitin-activating enzyme E1 C
MTADMDNYMMYSGTEGVYTHTVKYERDPNDPVCGAGVALPVSPDMTLQQVRTTRTLFWGLPLELCQAALGGV